MLLYAVTPQEGSGHNRLTTYFSIVMIKIPRSRQHIEKYFIWPQGSREISVHHQADVEAGPAESSQPLATGHRLRVNRNWCMAFKTAKLPSGGTLCSARPCLFILPQIVPSTGDQAFKHLSLWRASPCQLSLSRHCDTV